MSGLAALECNVSCFFHGWKLDHRVPCFHHIFGKSFSSHYDDLADNLQVAFAACASLLVRDYAIHAKHSGIPEIKTVLGGFVIRRFMGTWTLVIKSLGLVCVSNPFRGLPAYC